MSSRSSGDSVAPLDEVAMIIHEFKFRNHDCIFSTCRTYAAANSPLCILSIGWRCTAAAARLDEFSPLDMASAGLRITGMELLMSLAFLRWI